MQSRRKRSKKQSDEDELNDINKLLLNKRVRVAKVKRGNFKMNGLVANDYLKAGTVIGHYPGDIITTTQHKKIINDLKRYYQKYPTPPTYSGEEYAFDVDGNHVKVPINKAPSGTQQRFIRDPKKKPGTISYVHKRNPVPYVNEPGKNMYPNAAFVNDGGKNIALIVMTPITSGSEITACYGSEYDRDYETGHCESVHQYAIIEGQLYRKVGTRWVLSNTQIFNQDGFRRDSKFIRFDNSGSYKAFNVSEARQLPPKKRHTEHTTSQRAPLKRYKPVKGKGGRKRNRRKTRRRKYSR